MQETTFKLKDIPRSGHGSDLTNSIEKRPSTSAQVQSILQEVRESLKKAAALRGEIAVDAQRVFEKYDLGGWGYISLEQFKNCLAFLGVMLSDQSKISSLAFSYDIGEVGEKIDYVKFCKDVDDTTKDINEKSLRLKLVDAFRYCEEQGVNIYDVFAR